MGSKRRSELEITRDVLDVCVKGANKTRIVYVANLNFSRLNRYLRRLLNMGFLVKETRADGRVYYRTTPAGVWFLEGCSHIEEFREKNKRRRGKRGVRVKPV